MTKRNSPSIQWAVILALLVVVVVASESAVLSVRESAYCESKQKAKAASCAVDQEPWDLRAARDPVAVFTFLLFAVAAGQAALFWWQLALIRDGAIDARDAARAAMASAEATAGQLKLVENLERPWVFFIPPAFGKIGYSDGGKPEAFPSIDFTLRNYGRSPAVIQSAEVVLAVTQEPPTRVENCPLPYVSGNGGHPRDRYYYAGHTWTNPVLPPGESFDRSDLQRLMLTERQQADLATGTQRLWIDGRVTYTDVFGQAQRQTQFRYAYDYIMDILVQEGGRDFNWQT